MAEAVLLHNLAEDARRRSSLTIEDAGETLQAEQVVVR